MPRVPSRSTGDTGMEAIGCGRGGPGGRAPRPPPRRGSAAGTGRMGRAVSGGRTAREGTPAHAPFARVRCRVRLLDWLTLRPRVNSRCCAFCRLFSRSALGRPCCGMPRPCMRSRLHHPGPQGRACPKVLPPSSPASRLHPMCRPAAGHGGQGWPRGGVRAARLTCLGSLACRPVWPRRLSRRRTKLKALADRARTE